MSESMRLQKFLSKAGRASRREAESLISAGRVSVNGVPTTELGVRVLPGQDKVELDGATVSLDEVEQWIMLHKPAGVLTTRSDPHGGQTVYDGLPSEYRHLKYLGRLDKDTEGLLILSNDGDMLNRLAHPSGEVEREYRATVTRVPPKAALDKLRKGVLLGDGPAVAKRVEIVDKEGRNAVVSIVVTEGRKREVRRMFDAVGHPVKRLIRVRFGVVELGDLPKGATRPLKPDEIQRLRELIPGA